MTLQTAGAMAAGVVAQRGATATSISASKVGSCARSNSSGESVPHCRCCGKQTACAQLGIAGISHSERQLTALSMCLDWFIHSLIFLLNQTFLRSIIQARGHEVSGLSMHGALPTKAVLMQGEATADAALHNVAMYCSEGPSDSTVCREKLFSDSSSDAGFAEATV